MFSVRKQSDSNTVFICAKAKRQQQQSAQPERKSTTRYGDEPIYWRKKVFKIN